MHTRRRLPITLIEMLLVILIITVIGSAAAFSLRHLIREQQFRADVETLTNSLRIAQDMMLALDQDIEVKIEPKQHSFSLKLAFDVKIPERWEKLLQREQILKAIKSIEFVEDSASYLSKASGTITLKFMSRGSVMSKGYLIIRSEPAGSQGYQALICLKGYPSFFAPHEASSTADCLRQQQEEQFIDTQLSQDTEQLLHRTH